MTKDCEEINFNKAEQSHPDNFEQALIKQDKHIWLSVAEYSADMHAAALVKALQKKSAALKFKGITGPFLREAGVGGDIGIEQLSIMGGVEVLLALPRIFKILWKVKKELRLNPPQAIILVDAPDFNFRIAKIAYKLNIPVYYYISPKVWAWRLGRVNFLKKYIKKLILILPFEQTFFAKFEVPAVYVGNPLLDFMAEQNLENVSKVSGRIGLMPGSRKKEVTALMPEVAVAARILLKLRPDLSFHCIRAANISEELIRSLWPAELPLIVEEPNQRYLLMKSCQIMLAASGTATLELALLNTPTIVIYRFSRLTSFLIKKLIKVRFASLPNLILDKACFPELLFEQAKGEIIAKQALTWLTDTKALEAVYKDLEQVRLSLGEPGAVDRAADVILSDLTD